MGGSVRRAQKARRSKTSRTSKSGKTNRKVYRKKRRTKGPTTCKIVRIINADQPKVSVIIPAMNEKKTIRQVIVQCRNVHRDAEVIVVSNGSTDGTAAIAQDMGARVLEYANPLGHDVGRSVGAMAAKGDILLFTDADIVIPARDMIPLVEAVEKNGIDIALNKYRGKVDKQSVHRVVLAKHALNQVLTRSDLQGASLTAIPHAVSRRAVEVIGFENLAVPPLAQAVGAWHGLKLEAVHYINVGSGNPKKRRQYRVDPLELLILGDHLEAMHWLTEQSDPRAAYTDLNRQRGAVR